VPGFRRNTLAFTGVALIATLVCACPVSAAAVEDIPNRQETGKDPAPPAPARVPGKPRSPSAPRSPYGDTTPAAAKETVAAKPAARSAPASATQGYSMDFTLPTLGKSGCMVCHGDRNLIRVQGNQYVSYYVDENTLRGSAHGRILCTGCHVDFAFKAPHKNANSEDWRKTARLACKNCHQEAYDAFSKGVHSVSSKPGQVDPKADQKPLCGDCHGAHDISVLASSVAGQNRLAADGYRVCGRCHKEQWDSYADYYHGAAYRRGAIDAPACWDCHEAHTTLPSSDRRASTYPDRLIATCGKCHDGVTEGFVSYVGLVHRRGKALSDNPVYAFLQSVQEGISNTLSNIVGTVRSWFT
jgi:hypothetical protein